MISIKLLKKKKLEKKGVGAPDKPPQTFRGSLLHFCVLGKTTDLCERQVRLAFLE